jgi:hypothetical protein
VGKRFRRTVAGIPVARFRTRLTSMAARRGIAIIGVDAAYTSKWGAHHCAKPLQQQTSEPVTRHHGATGRAHHQPNHGGRHGSSGPPERTRRAPVHRKTAASRTNTVRAATEQQQRPPLPTQKERFVTKDRQPVHSAASLST